MENADIFDDITDELDRIGIETEVPIVHAIFVQDHSGSMNVDAGNGSPRSKLAMNNYNEQLAIIKRESQKEVLTTITVIEFDDRILINGSPLTVFEETEAKDVKDVNEMTTWWCGGATALRDAIGAAINIGSNLIKRHKPAKDQSVLVVILTDGEENCSKEWSDGQIRKEIKKLEDSELWTFTFMGGELQTSEAIANMGFATGNTMSYNNDVDGFKMSGVKTISGINKYYTARKVGETQVKDFFVDEEEKKAWQQNTKENT